MVRGRVAVEIKLEGIRQIVAGIPMFGCVLDAYTVAHAVDRERIMDDVFVRGVKFRDHVVPLARG